jgi:ribonuclease-3
VTERTERVQRLIEYEFHDPSLLHRALTHASAGPDSEAGNERLEFLGDAVADAVVADLLYTHPDRLSEGRMTAARADAASSRTMARVADDMGLTPYLQVGDGMPPRGEWPRSLAANVYEAVVGAVYLDGGYEAARDLVKRTLGPETQRAVREGASGDYKSRLQEAVQGDGGSPPTYETLRKTEPDHAARFEAAVRVNGSRAARAWGGSKQEAEQEAARRALEDMRASDEQVEPRSCD